MLKFKDATFKTSPNKLYVGLCLFPIFVASFLSLSILLLFKFLPSMLPLFYSLPWGDNQLGSRGQFFIIPAIITLIALANLIISWQLHSTQSFFKKVLGLSSLVTSLILTITFIKIVLLFI